MMEIGDNIGVSIVDVEAGADAWPELLQVLNSLCTALHYIALVFTCLPRSELHCITLKRIKHKKLQFFPISPRCFGPFMALENFIKPWYLVRPPLPLLIGTKSQLWPFFSFFEGPPLQFQLCTWLPAI